METEPNPYDPPDVPPPDPPARPGTRGPDALVLMIVVTTAGMIALPFLFDISPWVRRGWFAWLVCPAAGLSVIVAVGAATLGRWTIASAAAVAALGLVVAAGLFLTA